MAKRRSQAREGVPHRSRPGVGAAHGPGCLSPSTLNPFLLSLAAMAGCSGLAKSSLPDDSDPELRRSARACDRDDEDACLEVGSALVQLRDPHYGALGVRLIGLACDGGSDRACDQLLQRRLPGASPTRSRLVECDKGDARACLDAAEVLGDDAHASRGSYDPELAFDARSRACEAGLRAACEPLFSHHLGPGDDAVGCDRDRAEACVALARTLDVNQPGLAQTARQRACRLGHAGACAQLATDALERGDRVTALSHATTACELGEVDACRDFETLNLPRGVPSTARAVATECDLRTRIDACADLANIYADAGHSERAIALLDALPSSPALERTLGFLLARPGPRHDRSRALELLARHCNWEQLHACRAVLELDSTDSQREAPLSEHTAAALAGACDGGDWRACLRLNGTLATTRRDPEDLPTNVVRVSNAQQLVDAMRDETMIVLEPGTYSLAYVTEPDEEEGGCFRFDGSEMACENVTVLGAGIDRTIVELGGDVRSLRFCDASVTFEALTIRQTANLPLERALIAAVDLQHIRLRNVRFDCRGHRGMYAVEIYASSWLDGVVFDGCATPAFSFAPFDDHDWWLANVWFVDGRGAPALDVDTVPFQARGLYFVDNHGDGPSGLIQVTRGARLDIDGMLLSGNTGDLVVSGDEGSLQATDVRWTANDFACSDPAGDAFCPLTDTLSWAR